MKDFVQLVMSLAVVAIPVLAGFISKSLIQSKKAVELIQILEPLAKSAVIAAEQLGLVDKLDSVAKKSKAISYVKSALINLGFTKTDEQTIANAVEQAYADTTKQLEETYNGGAHDAN